MYRPYNNSYYYSPFQDSKSLAAIDPSLDAAQLLSRKGAIFLSAFKTEQEVQDKTP